MTSIEENSLRAQVKLMKDIIANYRSITYGVVQQGVKMRELLRSNTVALENTVNLTTENFDKLLDIANILQEERKWYKLGILAESAVPDNIIKKEILELLQGK